MLSVVEKSLRKELPTLSNNNKTTIAKILKVQQFGSCRSEFIHTLIPDIY